MNFSYSGKLALPMRAQVFAVEHRLQEQEQVDCPVREYFIPGGYAREMTIPKGTMLTGAIHKKPSIIILSAGRIILATEDGPLEVSAPFTVVCAPGAKNLGYAVETCVWTNFFVTDETDPDKLVEELTESKTSELLGGKDNKQLLNSKKEKPWLLD